MLVQSSTQHPTEIQHKVAHAIGRPMHAVRVETRRMGGGFGGKESQGNALAIACAVAAQRTGQPCKMRYDRDDDMRITGKRHDFRIDYTVGFDATGTLTGSWITWPSISNLILWPCAARITTRTRRRCSRQHPITSR